MIEKSQNIVKLIAEDITDKDYTHAKDLIKYLKNQGQKIQMIIMTCMFKVINYCLQMYLKTLERSV